MLDLICDHFRLCCLAMRFFFVDGEDPFQRLLKRQMIGFPIQIARSWEPIFRGVVCMYIGCTALLLLMAL